uniref:Uncharacterized protein n=1 Tax=Anguilla anguilla TaxID=7936 RepID=A0A0E9TLB8_ANGAN
MENLASRWMWHTYKTGSHVLGTVDQH